MSQRNTSDGGLPSRSHEIKNKTDARVVDTLDSSEVLKQANPTEESKSGLSLMPKELAMPLIDYRALSNLLYHDFHGQEEGEDEEFDALEKRYQESEIRLANAINALITQHTLEARIVGVTMALYCVDTGSPEEKRINNLLESLKKGQA